MPGMPSRTGRRPPPKWPRSASMRSATRLRPRTVADSGDDGVVEGILRQSDERWGNYLSPVDPTDMPARRSRMEPDSIEESDDRSPATIRPCWLSIAGALLGLADAFRAMREVSPCRSSPGRAAPPRDRDGRPPRIDRSTDPARTRVHQGIAIGLEIPPLPTRIDLDDEMREAFLADASELFERIERIVIRLDSRDDPREAIHELGRCLHTLKGAAGSVGLNELASLVHELEGAAADRRATASRRT